MTDYTHYYYLVGDGHIRGRRGPGPTMVDPLLGQILTVAYAPLTAPVVNTVVRGATSGAWGRVIRVLSPTSWVIESWPATITVNIAPGVPFGVTQPGATFAPNELVNFDNGGSSNVTPFQAFQSLPQGSQFVHEHRDARTNTPIPDDRSDTTFWDRHAKYSRTVVLDGTTIAPGEIFTQGYKCTTSGGAAFTILLGNNSGSDFQLQVMSVTGTLAVGQVVTNTTTGHTATIKSLGAETPVGAFVPFDLLPNNAGTASLWEFPPNGNGTDGSDPSIGPEATLLRRAFDKHRGATSLPDRGTRLVPFSTFDDYAPLSTDAYIGGVTLQTVKCSGTFPTTWQAGETVTCGAWTGVVHGFSATNKYLFVYDVNGATLAGGTLTGANSGATVTCSGPAIGWQPGSSYWNNLMAQRTAARASVGGTYSGSAPKDEGLVLMIWEAEVIMFGATVGAAWPSLERMTAQWVKLITEMRTAMGNPDLPVAVWRNDIRSHASDVQYLGVPFAALLQQVIDGLPRVLSKVRAFTSDGMEGSQSTPLPVATSLLFLRTDDYPELGERAWRALEFSAVVIPAGNFEPLPIILMAGQSQLVGGIPWSMLTIDTDPDLYSSALFPVSGGNTVDTSVLHFRADTLAWEPYDIYYANMFWNQGPGNFGMEAPLVMRMKRRFAEEPSTTAEIGIIKVGVGGASVNANCGTAFATFDPDASARPITVANCNVTVFAATSLLPARGRFTAAAGTFSSWAVGEMAVVTGSLLGYQGLGGNNTQPYKASPCKARAEDGSWVEIEGSFVPEAGTGVGYLVNNGAGYAIGASTIAVDTGTGTVLLGDRVTFAGHATVYTVTTGLSGGAIQITPALTSSVADNAAMTIATRSFTLTMGPLPLAAAVEQVIRVAFEKCATQLRRIPKPVAKIWWNGESDLERAAEYQASLERVLAWLENIFGQRHKGEEQTATCILELTPNTPFGYPDASIQQVIDAQRAIAAALPNAVAVSTAKLPMQSSGVFPRTHRLHNGVHHTARGFLMAGFLADEGLGTLTGIPAHPEGSAAVDFGAVDGGVSGAGAGSDALAESAGTDEVTPAQAAAASTAIGEALALQPDVAGYSVTRDGHSVTRRSLKDLIEAADYLEYKAARAAGLTHTLADFNS